VVGYVEVFASSGSTTNSTLVASTQGEVSIFGGDNASCQVGMSSYGSYAFLGWQDGTNGTLDTVTSGSGTVSSVVATRSSSASVTCERPWVRMR
jgi:hypothetical protein